MTPVPRCTIQCGVHTFCAFLMDNPATALWPIHLPTLPCSTPLYPIIFYSLSHPSSPPSLPAKYNIAKEQQEKKFPQQQRSLLLLPAPLSRNEFDYIFFCSLYNTAFYPSIFYTYRIVAKGQSNHNIMKHAMQWVDQVGSLSIDMDTAIQLDPLPGRYSACKQPTHTQTHTHTHG